MKIKQIHCMSLIIAILALLWSVAWLDPYRDAVSSGNEEFKDKKYNNAKRYYQKANDFVPGEEDRKKLTFNEGDADYMLESYDNALASFQQAVQSEDRNVQKKAFFNMGNLYLKQKNYREAIRAYQNALKIDPKYAPPKKNIEYLLKQKEREKDQKNKQDDKKNKGDKSGTDRDRSQKDKQQSGRQEKQQAGGQDRQGTMNKEQIKNLLRSMQNNPVQRKKGGADERRKLEKFW